MLKVWLQDKCSRSRELKIHETTHTWSCARSFWRGEELGQLVVPTGIRFPPAIPTPPGSCDHATKDSHQLVEMLTRIARICWLSRRRSGLCRQERNQPYGRQKACQSGYERPPSNDREYQKRHVHRWPFLQAGNQSQERHHGINCHSVLRSGGEPHPWQVEQSKEDEHSGNTLSSRWPTIKTSRRPDDHTTWLTSKSSLQKELTTGRFFG